MKIKVLAENTACNEHFSCEHGLSLYVEAERKILFDSGQTNLFSDNAKTMGIDLTQIDFAVLSHGHYDHSGGMLKFAEINEKAPIYINKNAFGEFYNGTEKFIGIDKKLADTNIVLTGESFRITDNIELFTCNTERALYETQSIGLNELKDCNFLQDSFLHEQYMLINDKGRKILFSGCSHKGILNIIEWVKPDVFIGGFHLVKLDPQADGKNQLDMIAEKLLKTDCTYYTCHCTGIEQYKYLKEKMQDKLTYISSGYEFEI